MRPAVEDFTGFTFPLAEPPPEPPVDELLAPLLANERAQMRRVGLDPMSAADLIRWDSMIEAIDALPNPFDHHDIEETS
jgi:hypothetical protein